MISFKLPEALESPSASTPSMEKVKFKDSTDKMRDVTAKPPSPQISGCEMVSSAEDTKVEDSQSPSRRKVTINKDTKTPRISITRKIDRSTTPRSEVESSSNRIPESRILTRSSRRRRLVLVFLSEKKRRKNPPRPPTRRRTRRIRRSQPLAGPKTQSHQQREDPL